jgi:hypothetical protein
MIVAPHVRAGTGSFAQREEHRAHARGERCVDQEDEGAPGVVLPKTSPTGVSELQRLPIRGDLVLGTSGASRSEVISFSEPPELPDLR